MANPSSLEVDGENAYEEKHIGVHKVISREYGFSHDVD